jgi:hypothetical protein
MSRHRRTLHRLAPALLTTLALSACIIFVGPSDRDDEVRSLVAARARWNTNGVADYDLTARALCFCFLGGQSVRVSVRGGRVVEALVVSTGEPVPSHSASTYGTVEHLFDVIEDAVQRKAHSIDATYDAQYGYPKRFVIDYVENAADEEFGYEIDSFTLAVSR